MIGLGKTRTALTTAADKVKAAAQDTRATVLAIAGLAALALVVALAALALAVRARKAAA